MGRIFTPGGEQTESGHDPPAGKGGVQAKLPTSYIKFLVKHASGNSVMATPPRPKVPVLGDTAGPWRGRGSPGLTREAVGLGRGVAVRVPLPGLLHLPLVEEVAQACAGVQAVPREGRHPSALNPSPPKEPTWGGGYCRGWDSHREHIQGHFLTGSGGAGGGVYVLHTPDV